MAKDVDLTSREWRDIVFDGKNKEYGAYKLRETSPARHTKAIVWVVICVAIILILLILSISGVFSKPEEEQIVTSTVQEITNVDTQEEEIEEEEEEQVVFTENDFIVKDSLEQEKIWLVPNCQKNEMEPLLVTIKPKYSLPEDMPHEGEEFGYVLSGKIILHLGKNSYTVKAKESFYFVSDKLHYIENATNIPAKIIWISSPPTF